MFVIALERKSRFSKARGLETKMGENLLFALIRTVPKRREHVFSDDVDGGHSKIMCVYKEHCRSDLPTACDARHPPMSIKKKKKRERKEMKRPS